MKTYQVLTNRDGQPRWTAAMTVEDIKRHVDAERLEPTTSYRVHGTKAPAGIVLDLLSPKLQKTPPPVPTDTIKRDPVARLLKTSDMEFGLYVLSAICGLASLWAMKNGLQDSDASRTQLGLIGLLGTVLWIALATIIKHLNRLSQIAVHEFRKRNADNE